MLKKISPKKEEKKLNTSKNNLVNISQINFKGFRKIDEEPIDNRKIIFLHYIVDSIFHHPENINLDIDEKYKLIEWYRFIFFAIDYQLANITKPPNIDNELPFSSSAVEILAVEIGKIAESYGKSKNTEYEAYSKIIFDYVIQTYLGELKDEVNQAPNSFTKILEGYNNALATGNGVETCANALLIRLSDIKGKYDYFLRDGSTKDMYEITNGRNLFNLIKVALKIGYLFSYCNTTLESFITIKPEEVKTHRGRFIGLVGSNIEESVKQTKQQLKSNPGFISKDFERVRREGYQTYRQFELILDDLLNSYNNLLINYPYDTKMWKWIIVGIYIYLLTNKITDNLSSGGHTKDLINFKKLEVISHISAYLFDKGIVNEDSMLAWQVFNKEIVYQIESFLSKEKDVDKNLYFILRTIINLRDLKEFNLNTEPSLKIFEKTVQDIINYINNLFEQEEKTGKQVNEKLKKMLFIRNNNDTIKIKDLPQEDLFDIYEKVQSLFPVPINSSICDYEWNHFISWSIDVHLGFYGYILDDINKSQQLCSQWFRQLNNNQIVARRLAFASILSDNGDWENIAEILCILLHDTDADYEYLVEELHDTEHHTTIAKTLEIKYYKRKVNAIKNKMIEVQHFIEDEFKKIPKK